MFSEQSLYRQAEQARRIDQEKGYDGRLIDAAKWTADRQWERGELGEERDRVRAEIYKRLGI